MLAKRLNLSGDGCFVYADASDVSAGCHPALRLSGHYVMNLNQLVCRTALS
jgi:hypothetical protein